MTTDTNTEAAKIEAAQASVTEAQTALDAARKAASEYAAEIMALDTRTEEQEDKLADLTLARRKAATTLEQRTEVLTEARKASVFEGLLSVRTPVRDAFRAMLVEATPTVSVESASATVAIVTGEDGKPSVQVNIVPVLSKLDLDTIKQAIAATVDIAAFNKAGITGVTYSITDIGKPNAMVDDKPTLKGASSKPSATGDGARSGALSYEYNGEWLSAKAFLTAVEASGHAIATDRAVSFETSLRGTHNGLSTLAKQVADKLNVPSKTASK